MAYLYPPRSPGAKDARTLDVGRGLRIDFDARAVPIGVELTFCRSSDASKELTSAVGRALMREVMARAGRYALRPWEPYDPSYRQ